MIRLTGGTPSYSSGPGGPRGSMVRGINPGESYTLLSKKGNQVPYTTPLSPPLIELCTFSSILRMSTCCVRFLRQ
jgi:hypothetical protein